MRVKEEPLVLGGKIFPFTDKFEKDGVVPSGDFTGPGKEKPYLKIEQVLVSELPEPFGCRG